jgi:general secretion pathway protein G
MPNVFFFRNPPFLLDQRTGRLRYQRIFLILVALVAIGFALPRLVTTVYKQHDTKTSTALKDMATIVQGLADYKKDNGMYPSTEQGLLALILKPTRGPAAKGWETGGYIDRLPHDPWGNPYQYRIDEAEQTYQVFSYGPLGPEADGDNGEGNGAIFAR